jgi:hypothetical protein
VRLSRETRTRPHRAREAQTSHIFGQKRYFFNVIFNEGWNNFTEFESLFLWLLIF